MICDSITPKERLKRPSLVVNFFHERFLRFRLRQYRVAINACEWATSEALREAIDLRAEVVKIQNMQRDYGFKSEEEYETEDITPIFVRWLWIITIASLLGFGLMILGLK